MQQKTIAFQSTQEAYTIYEKKSGQAIGFAGMTEVEPHVYEDTVFLPPRGIYGSIK